MAKVENQSGKGLFNFQQIMKDFYGSKATSEDQQLQKDAFAGNLVQSGFDSQMAQMLAQNNASLAQGNMTHQADLELRNQSAIMAQEFNYGMQSMEAQFNYENKFADKQHVRDLGMVSAVGEQERLNIKTTGEQDRLNIGAQGDQDVRKIESQGGVDEKLINTQGDVDISKITTQESSQAQREVGNIQTTGTEERKNIAAQSTADISKIQAQNQADKGTIGAQGDQDVRKIGAQGSEDRKTLETADNLEAKKQNRATARSRTMARAF